MVTYQDVIRVIQSLIEGKLVWRRPVIGTADTPRELVDSVSDLDFANYVFEVDDNITEFWVNRHQVPHPGIGVVNTFKAFMSEREANVDKAGVGSKTFYKDYHGKVD